ncbi:flagellar basal body P-ring protein FlgI, partial [Vibrio parahaemolyticus]
MRNPDLTTARRMAQAISTFLGQPASRALDPSTVQVDIPEGMKSDVIGLM